MKEAEIGVLTQELRRAFYVQNEELSAEMAIALLRGFLVNVSRIADAAEAIRPTRRENK